MALKKDILTKFGFDANYLKIQNTAIHTNGDIELSGLILLYKDQAQRALDHGSHIDSATFSFKVTSEELVGDSQALVYNKIKESILDEQGKETNKFHFTHSGEIGLQGALDV